MTRTGRIATLSITLLALSAQFCPCPATAADVEEPTGDNTHHVHQSQPSNDIADCHGAESRDDCGMAAGSAPELSPKVNKPFADGLAPPPASGFLNLPLVVAHRTADRPPDPGPLLLSNPVTRADRLLH